MQMGRCVFLTFLMGPGILSAVMHLLSVKVKGWVCPISERVIMTQKWLENWEEV